MIYYVAAAGIIAAFCGLAWTVDRLDAALQRWLAMPLADDDTDDDTDKNDPLE